MAYQTVAVCNKCRSGFIRDAPLREQVGLVVGQAQHMLARQDGVAVALAGRAWQQEDDAALRLAGELVAQRGQVGLLVALAPGLEAVRRLNQLLVQGAVRFAVAVLLL